MAQKQKEEVTTRDDAAVILTSAVFYCQRAGIDVGYAVDEQGKLVLVLEGLMVQSTTADSIRFVPTPEGYVPVKPGEREKSMARD